MTFTCLPKATHKRSQNAESVVDNKAVIIVLAAYANAGGTSTLIPRQKTGPGPDMQSYGSRTVMV
ncbi:MAG: hypothetical protein COA75_04825 [Cellvibrionales bacterium]|nr:MAG: hypothetical protein COA75_04825 [Cellvibrionales bacterium]